LNQFDGFGPAALWRFDLKVEFGFLRAGQAAALFERYCAALEFRERISGERFQFICIDKRTPGDFAVVARQHRFRPIPVVPRISSHCSRPKAPSRWA
jgi:hypothetical protein